MKLKFYPRPGMLCWDPERRPSFGGGQPAGYVGRHLVTPKRDGDGRVLEPARYVANDDAYETHAASRSGARLAKLCRRGELWAADPQTAAYCGVSYEPVAKGDDGEWHQKATPPTLEKGRIQPSKD